MASRLYRTTRQLYLAVEAALLRLHLNTLGTPTLAALLALAVTGLILLDARPTHTRLARFLPGRCHARLRPKHGSRIVLDLAFLRTVMPKDGILD
jgi:hypothetical protein